LGENLATKQHFIPFPPIQLAQAPVVMNLTTEETYDDKSAGPMKYNKLSAIEERLRAYEGNDLFNPIRGAKIYLVPNIMVPKDFRVSDLIKYTRLEFLNTHL
jgi:hypothetical protein